MEAFYIHSHNRLFAIYHPARGKPRVTGVVIVQTVGHEQIRAHTAVRVLADHLSASGYEVLRFDLSGHGDSEGETDCTTLAWWRQDVSAAVDSICEGTACRSVCLVGIRLGAAVAMVQCEQLPTVRSAVLWEPCLSGWQWIEQMKQAQSTFLAGSFAVRGSSSPGHLEVLGHVLSPHLMRELSELNCDIASPGQVAKALLLSNNHGSELDRLKTHWLQMGVQVTVSTPKSCSWVAGTGNEGRVLVPATQLQEVREWMTRNCP